MKESEQAACFTIKTPEIFSFTECLWFLDRNYDDCLHQIEAQQLTKAVNAPDSPLLFRLHEENEALCVSILKGRLTIQNELFLKQYIRDYIDLDTPLDAYYRILNNDPRLAYMTETFKGLRMTGLPDLFEALVWSIIGQQINLTFAYRLKRRLVEAYGTKMQHSCGDFYLFPIPEILATATPEDLRPMQFSGNKARYIIGLARLFAEGRLSKEILQHAPNINDRLKLLMDIKGVGIWTANYVLIKSMKEKDCIPYGDAGLINALKQHGIVESRPTQQQIDDFFGRFSGWQSYLVFYLWRSLAVPKY